jgi:hypothetical protein
MQQALIILVSGCSLVAVVLGAIWFVTRNAKSAGQAEAQRDASQAARKTEQDMADAMAQNQSTEQTRADLNDGNF